MMLFLWSAVAGTPAGVYMGNERTDGFDDQSCMIGGHSWKPRLTDYYEKEPLEEGAARIGHDLKRRRAYFQWTPEQGSPRFTPLTWDRAFKPPGLHEVGKLRGTFFAHCGVPELSKEQWLDVLTTGARWQRRIRTALFVDWMLGMGNDWRSGRAAYTRCLRRRGGCDELAGFLAHWSETEEGFQDVQHSAKFPHGTPPAIDKRSLPTSY